MAPTSSSVHAEKELLTGCATVLVPRVSPTASACLESLHHQQEGLSQSPFNLLTLPFKDKVSFPTALRDSLKQGLLAFKAKHSRDSSSQCRTPGLGA